LPAENPPSAFAQRTARIGRILSPLALAEPGCDQGHSDALAAGGRWADIHPAAVEDRLGPVAAYWVENDHNKINAIPQIGWLPPIEDRLGDIRREIAEADEPREIRPADPLLLDAVSCPNSPETELPPHGGRRRCGILFPPTSRARARETSDDNPPLVVPGFFY
jgi:hypothetical protein